MNLIAFAAMMQLSASQLPERQRCSVAVENSSAIVLRDGREVAINDRSITQSGTSLLILGPPAYAWPLAWPTGKIEKIFGAVRNRRGEFSPVALPSANADLPHAVRDARGGWHVLYLENLSSNYKKFRPADSALLYYARYDGRSWSNKHVVAKLFDTQIQHDFTSTVEQAAGELVWLVPFESPASAKQRKVARHGVLAIRWSLLQLKVRVDTLLTDQPPLYTRLIAGDKPGSLVAFVTQDYYHDGRLWQNTLFASSFDRIWKPFSVFLTDSTSGFYAPSITRQMDRIAVTWVESRTESKTAGVNTVSKFTDGRVGTPDRIAETRPFNTPFALALDNRRTGVFVISPGLNNELGVFVGNGERVSSIGSVPFPVETFSPVVIKESESTLFVTSAALGARGNPALPKSMFIKIGINCK